MGFWYVLAFHLASFLPFWLDRLIARIIALGFFVFNRSQRRGVLANLQIIRPHATHYERMKLAIGTFEQAGLNLVDFFRIPSLSRSGIIGMTQNFEQVQPLVEERVHGKKFCLVAGHYGNWELAGAVLGVAGYKIHAIALSHNSPIIENLYDSLRQRFNVTTHDVQFGMRQLLRNLPDGDVPAIISDREYSIGGEPVQFFGRTVYFPRGAALLCHRKQMTGVPGFLVRQSDGRFRVEFGDPIHPDSTDEREWIHEFVSSFARQYEKEVDCDPTQFLNFYDFWNGRP